MFDFLRRWTQTEHERVAENLSAYVDDELTVKAAHKVETHLAQCDACKEDLRTLRYTKSLLAQVPAPSLPRSFVIRQADLEEAAPAPRTIFGLRPRLAYTYLRGATVAVTVAFALVVAGEQLAQFGLGARQPEMAMAPQTRQMQETAVETTLVEAVPAQADAVEESTLTTVELEKEGEKAVLPSASPPPSEKQEESIRALEVSKEPTEAAAVEEAPSVTEPATVEEAYGVETTPTPGPQPTSVSETVTPLPTSPPTPPPQPSPTSMPTETERVTAQEGLSPLRVAEIGLGGLALLLLIVTLIVRQQRL